MALTGRCRACGPPRDGLVRAGAELTVENDRPRATEGNLRIAIEPAGEGTGRIEQRLTIAPNSTTRVLVPVRVPCEGAVRATLSNPSGARRVVRLRVRCRDARLSGASFLLELGALAGAAPARAGQRASPRWGAHARPRSARG